REARAAAPAQPGLLHLRDDLLRRDLLGEDLPERGVAAARLVVLQAPVEPVEPLQDDRVGTVEIRGERRYRQPHQSSPFRNSSSFSGVIAHSMRLLLSSTTGASPQAPRHSASRSVKRPSALVSLKPTPSFRFRWAAATLAPC